MNLGNTQLEFKIEKALRLLTEFMPADEDRKKPILMHALRVGMSLYERGYSEDVVIAGFLHDIIEWAESPEKFIREEFGQKVFDIIKANTKDRSIEDLHERRKDYVERCVKVGVEALIVKTADTLDSYNFYQATNVPDEIERSQEIGNLLLDSVPDGVEDPIFDQLKSIVV
ncbi:MAG: HD domain-containing protein [bacterium]